MQLDDVLKKTAAKKKGIQRKRPKASAAGKDRPYENDLKKQVDEAPRASMTTTQLFTGLMRQFASDAYHSVREEVTGRLTLMIERGKKFTRKQ